MRSNMCSRCKTNERAPGQGYCLPCRSEYNKERKPQVRKGATNVTWQRWYLLSKKIPGLTLDEVVAFEERFDGHCEACGKEINGREKHLDHDDKAKVLRGWLCRACNIGLGHFDHSVERLKAAERYLLQKADGQVLDFPNSNALN